MYHLDQLYSTFTQKWNEQYIKFCSMHTCIWYLKFWRNVTKLQLIMHTWYLSSWIVGLLSPTLNAGSSFSKSKCFCFNNLCSVFEMMSDIPSMQKPCWGYEPRCVISGGSDTAFWLTWRSHDHWYSYGSILKYYAVRSHPFSVLQTKLFWSAKLYPWYVHLISHIQSRTQTINDHLLLLNFQYLSIWCRVCAAELC